MRASLRRQSSIARLPGIAASALAAAAHFEGAKSWQGNGVAFLQGFSDGFGQRRHGPRGLSLAGAGFRSYGFDEFVLVHESPFQGWVIGFIVYAARQGKKSFSLFSISEHARPAHHPISWFSRVR